MLTKTPGSNTSSGNHLAGLDHLRSLAILLVFAYHYGRLFPHPQWMDSVTQFGWTGVDLFFVLSGYLIASQLFATIAAGEKISYKEFFIKRSFRILPAYFFVLLIYFLFPYSHEREALAPLWKYLSFTQNLGLDLRYHGTFSHAWSLCIEEQFYLLLPLSLIMLTYFKAIKKSYFILIALFVFGCIARIYCWHYKVAPFADSDEIWIYWYKCIYYPTYARLDGLLAGVTIAALMQFKLGFRGFLQKNGTLLLITGIIVLTGAYILCDYQETFSASVIGFPVISIGYGLLVMAAICKSSVHYKHSSAISSRLATLSYSVYLIHKITIHITQDLLLKLNVARESNIMLFICIVTTLLCAWLVNRVIEKPFMRLRKNLLSPGHSR